MFATSQQVSILSVSKLNRFAKRVLESEIGLVWVSGEISNFVKASSGHWYFTLKDSQAQVRTAMFKGANQRANFIPKAGDKVVVRANISLYEPRGDYQLIAQHIEPEGVGQLKQAYEALKAALKEEGLFEQAHKKPLPEHVRRLGVVTSPTGAAIHDILHVLARRNPAIEVIIYPSMVQGEQAAANIASQIQIANRRKEVDVLIVGRGGGSLEDLWPFNEEIVARAIFNSELPVVSAVGHEVDVSIADFVADLRCPTPSAAAETISQDAQVLKRNIQNLQNRLQQGITQRLRNQSQGLDIVMANFNAASPIQKVREYSQSLRNLQKRLQMSHPQTAIELQKRKNDELTKRLQRAFTGISKDRKAQCKNQVKRLMRLEPSRDVKRLESYRRELEAKLIRLQQSYLDASAQKVASQASMLQSVSPLATLARGYSISYQNEEIVRSTEQVETGETLVTKLKDGELISEVTRISKNLPT